MNVVYLKHNYSDPALKDYHINTIALILQIYDNHKGTYAPALTVASFTADCITYAY